MFLIVGVYVCVAENSLGFTEAKATITIQKDVRAPTLIFEPYDIEALPGTTIEMPCQGEGYPKPEVNLHLVIFMNSLPIYLWKFKLKVQRV